MVGLYELLRVSKKGIILIEPQDEHIRTNVLNILSRSLKEFVDSLFGRKINRHQYEDVGNYIYSISKREIEKVAVGLNYSTVAFKGMNDSYVEGAEDELLNEKGIILKKINRRIKFLDLLCKFGIKDYGLLVAIIFKEKPSSQTVLKMKKAGYAIEELPKNPYI